MRDAGFMRDETLYAKIVDGIGFRYLQVAALTGWHCKGIALNNRPMTPTLPFHQAWVDKQGVDKAKFLEHYNSLGVSTKSRKAVQMQNAFKIDGVPSIGVAGRFYTDGTLAKTMDRALQVTDYLIAEARKQR